MHCQHIAVPNLDDLANHVAMMADLSTCSGIIPICSYAFCRSNAVLNSLLAVLLNTTSISGNGDVNLQVFLFHSHKSTMVC